MKILSKIQTFNSKLESAISGGRFGVSQAGCRPAALFDGDNRMAIIIIDCSYSMDDTDYRPTRLKAAQNAAMEYVNTLVGQNTDTIATVISFSDEARVVVSPTSMSESQRIIQGIQSIKVDGGTNIGEGFKQVEKVLTGHNGQNQIILLTDGFGDCPLSISQRLKKRCGSIIDVVGIGGSPRDVNESLLKKVATTEPDGTNHYRFIADEGTLKLHYRKLATGLTRVGGGQ